MDGADTFLLAHPRYYERVARYEISREHEDALRALLPGGWQLHRHDVWLGAHRAGISIPPQGFKIHVSATPRGALETISRVVPVCVECEVLFKVAADPLLLSILNSKRYPRGGAGKFITIYPQDDGRFREIIERVHRATRELEGPYILSDRRYFDSSVVFYRYGGFHPRTRLRADGSQAPYIDGTDAVPMDDERTPYFFLPPGVEDPFPPEEETAGAPLLAGRFDVTKAFAFSNSGGVYRALDVETGATVVLKEARPRTHCWSDGTEHVDAISFLKHEHDVLCRFEHLGSFPRPVALFQEWEHWFLAQELVEGMPLRNYRAREDVILTPYMHDHARIEAFCTLFRTLADQLIKIVEKVHASGAVIGDLSPNNVMVDPDTLSVRVIDVESAYGPEDREVFAHFAASWYTPGFREHSRGRPAAHPSQADDFFALGMLLHGLVLPVEAFFDLAPSARLRFLDLFVEGGLPPFVRDAIAALLENRVADAKELLAQ